MIIVIVSHVMTVVIVISVIHSECLTVVVVIEFNAMTVVVAIFDVGQFSHDGYNHHA